MLGSGRAVRGPPERIVMALDCGAMPPPDSGEMDREPKVVVRKGKAVDVGARWRASVWRRRHGWVAQAPAKTFNLARRRRLSACGRIYRVWHRACTSIK
jgi:hypothetical protein